MKLGFVAVLACFAIATTTAEAWIEAPFTPTVIPVEKAVLASLTTPTPAFHCPGPTVRATFADGALPKGVTVSGSLSFEVGPSFQVSDVAVVSWLDLVVGDITVNCGGKGTRWHLVQFNFLDQAARANYDRENSTLSVCLPVLLTASQQPPVHAFLVLKGTVAADGIVWSSLAFAFEEMVARAFSGSPGVEAVIGPPAASGH